MDDEYYMNIAIEESKNGDWPYGAVIVKDGNIVAQAHNTSKKDKDSTAHAEVNAIRSAETALRNMSLDGCTLYTSSESCPMCTAAEIWAGVKRVVYGASIQQLIDAGQEQINTSSSSIIKTGFDPIELKGGVLANEAIAVVKDWAKKQKK